MTVVVNVVRDMLRPKIIALKTSSGLDSKARPGLSNAKTIATNAAIRELGTELALPVVDVEAMMGKCAEVHTTTSECAANVFAKRGYGLRDDVHPQWVVNRALGNIYLNALAVVGRQGWGWG